jgi:ABC-type lipoprotein export system ATPase subunit
LSILQVDNLQKGFDSPSGHIDVLRGVSLEVEPHEFVAVVGESGSGKSTLLQILGTLEPADDGDVLFEGRSIFGLSARAQARIRNEGIGFVYQAHHLIPELTALENVMLPLQVRGVPQADAEGRAHALLSRMHLDHRESHVPARLSGGEAQRVAVARALVGKPKLLLADEPTGNLDEATAHEVFTAMRELCAEEGASVVMVTHSLNLASSSDRMVRLSGGILE